VGGSGFCVTDGQQTLGNGKLKAGKALIVEYRMENGHSQLLSIMISVCGLTSKVIPVNMTTENTVVVAYSV
jgi:hypothetical protein